MQEILQELLTAIEEEKDAQKKYAKLAEMTDDPTAKAFFHQLVADEKEHERLLISRYKAISKLIEYQEKKSQDSCD